MSDRGRNRPWCSLVTLNVGSSGAKLWWPEGLPPSSRKSIECGIEHSTEDLYLTDSWSQT